MPETKSTAAPRLKLVIRRLPPTIPEDIFWKSISPWIDDGKSTWKKWYQGKKFDDSIRQHRVFSRAYVLMADFEKLQAFAGAFDGHVYRGKDGSEYQAVVEYAPSQKVPAQKNKPRVDARQGQIDKDPDFLSFCESLAAPLVKPELPAAGATEPAERVKSTPLLEYLKEQRMGKRASGLNDVITKTLHGSKAIDKDTARNRKDREKERSDKKKGGAVGGKQGGGNRNDKATTGPSSTLHAAVAGQIKIAKRPTADTGPDAKSHNKGGVPLPDLGKRSEVKIQIKQGGANESSKLGVQNLNAGGLNAAKGNLVKDARGGRGNSTNNNSQKPTRTDDSKNEKPSTDKKRDTNDRQGQTGQQPKKEKDPAIAGQGRRARPAANLLGGRNLLTAALKSSTRDTSATPTGNPDINGPGAKGGRNRDRGAKAGGASPAAGPAAAAPPVKDTAAAGANNPAGSESGAADRAAGVEKARRPPRNRGARGRGGGGGDGKPDAAHAGTAAAAAAAARIDA